MKLLEVKNDLAKIIFKPEDHNFLISDFLVVADRGVSLLSQIIHLESSDDDNMVCFVKFLLNIDENGNILNYNGFTPFKKTSKIFPVASKDILPLITSPNANINLGVLAGHQDLPVNIDYNLLRNKLYIQSDSQECTNNFVKNILFNTSKYNLPVVVLDFDGTFADFKYQRVTFGKNFKLPLNFEMLDFIYKNDLSELSLREKVTVQDIILDLQSFVKTTKSKFIPFETFYNIIESEYIKNPSDGIILMRNKLIKYAQDEIFAQSQRQFAYINQYLKDNGTLIVDLSGVQDKWHKIALNFILKLIWDKCIFITTVNNENSDKDTIQNILNSNIIHPVLISDYKFKLASQVKMVAKNLVLFAPISKTNDFATYNTFLNKLNNDEFIVWGKNTQYLSFIVKLKNIDEPVYEDVEEVYVPEIPKKQFIEPSKNNVVNNLSSDVREPVANILEEPAVEESREVVLTEEDEDKIIERDVDEMLFGKPKTENEEPEESQAEIEEETVEIPLVIDDADLGTTSIPINFESTTLDTSQQKIDAVEEQILPAPESQSNEILVSDDVVQSDIVIDEIEDIDLDLIDAINSENEPEESNTTIIEENNVADTQIIEQEQVPEQDVLIFEEENEVENIIVEEPQIKTYEPSDEVVNFEEFNEEEFFKENSSVNNQLQTEIVEQPVQIEQSPQSQSQPKTKNGNLPIYTSDDKPKNDLEFQEGNYVFHQKYGKGVVEKIVPYSNKKILYSIVFENGKRRLLDPNVTDLKKV